MEQEGESMGNPFLEPTNVFMYTLDLLRPAIKIEGPTETEAASVKRHWAHLQDLATKGQLIFAGRTLSIDDDGFASVIFRASSEDEARAVMERDPGIRENLFRGHLFPYQVLLMGTWVPEKESTGGEK
ncbi:MAG: YciI family protein [Omnitrophica WOR_2 bacterium]